MVKVLPTRVSFLLSLCLILFLSSCGEATPTYVGKVTYQPPFAPVAFSIDTNGNISVQGNLEIETPVGAFTLSAAASAKPQPDTTTLLLIIRHKQHNALIDSYYRIQTSNEEVTIVTNGTTTVNVLSHQITLDASEGTVQSIEVKDVRWDDKSKVHSSAPPVTPPSPSPIPRPTPQVPPTPTPVLPPQCTNQNGTPPNGAEATETTINCTLLSGFAAMIVVCNHALLSQPSYQDLEGPGMISYQSTTGSSSINIQAENSALANTACPSKFLVLPVTQVDGQAAIETQRLKDLIGNNVGITYYKFVGTNVMRTYT